MQNANKNHSCTFVLFDAKNIMSDIAIKVQNLSKRYRIGLEEEIHDTFAGALTDFVTSPIRNFRRLRRLSKFDDGRPGDGRRNDRPRPQSPSAKPTISSGPSRTSPSKSNAAKSSASSAATGRARSTLLKILSRITHPTSGRVELNGRVSSLLEVGTGFHPELTGRENIYLNGTILGMTKAEVERKFDEIVAFSGVEKFIDTPVKRYSSGMRVRLAFSVAAHLEPEILLVDEVLAVGDAEFQKKCLGKMGEVASEGRTVLFVSHDMSAILRLCERTILLENGHLSLSGGSYKVIGYYLEAGGGKKGEVIIPSTSIESYSDLQFRVIRSLNPGNEITDQVSLIEGIDIEIIYQINKPLENANVALHLFNNMGVCVLSSTDIDSNLSSVGETRDPGLYQTKCHISSEYLRSGRYYVGVSSSIPGVRVLANLPQILVFDVVDTGSVDSRSGQGRQGIIAPVLEWDIRKADNELAI